jgi:hypothetical protein
MHTTLRRASMIFLISRDEREHPQLYNFLSPLIIRIRDHLLFMFSNRRETISSVQRPVRRSTFFFLKIATSFEKLNGWNISKDFFQKAQIVDPIF